MVHWIETALVIGALLTGLVSFLFGLTMDEDPKGHLFAVGGLVIYLAVWVYGMVRASYT